MYLNTNGMLHTFKLRIFYIPDSKVRLLSTTSFLGTYTGENITLVPTHIHLSGLDNKPTRYKVSVLNNSISNLLTSVAYRYNDAMSVPMSLNTSLKTVHHDNVNLYEPNKEHLWWH